MSGRARARRPVPPEAYTEEYFRTAEAGFAAWERSGGREFGGFYLGALAIREPRAAERVLDIGTGRGEIPVLAAERGALGVGVDYSAAAMDLARVTRSARGSPAGARYVRAELTRLPFADASFDVVYAMDVVEHLTPRELARTLAEVRRVLRPGGPIVVHTMPNRLIYDVTYRALRAAARIAGRRWPREPRSPYELQMHVNETGPIRLARDLRRASFRPVRMWLGGLRHAGYVPSERVRASLERLVTVPLLRLLAAGDMWAVGLRPARPPGRQGRLVARDVRRLLQGRATGPR